MLACAFNKLLYPTPTNVAGSSAATGTKKMPTPASSAPSETQSEISSVDSDWSDIRAIALKLGVANAEELHTERFKVDRQKLEQMLKADSAIEGMNGAEHFFENIMKNTETYISWPCRLKIGAKSKKDPHVRIVGKFEEVQKAKERILSSLDSRGSRVIMKMDVSYTDHSYIIGRGGNNIKRIMEDTATHIHFPDSNRSNPTEKSNQVSLCGPLEGVERARALVRLSTPLLISFELPIMAPGRSQPDHDTPYVTMVETKFNVQVIFSSRPKLHSALVLVKGSEKEAAQVQEATQLLINFSCENIASEISVNMQLEISPQHHEIVKGKNNMNLLSIMERTKTKIIFPDLFDMNIKPLKKSQVTITGTIDGVYKARQQLIGNLPVALIFDFPDNQNDASEILNLGAKYGVFISLRQKQRQSTLAIVIKGLEKFIDKMYEARHEVLQLAGSPLKPEIPESYFTPNDNEMGSSELATLTAMLAGYPDSPKTPNLATAAHMQKSPYGNHANNNNSNNNANNNILFANSAQFAAYTGTPPNVYTPTQKYLQMHNNNCELQQPNCSNNFLQVAVPPMLQQQQQQAQQQQQLPLMISPRNSLGHNTSGYQSFSSSTNSLEQAYPPYGAAMGGTAAAGIGVVNNGIVGGGAGLRANYSPDSSSEAGCGRIGRRSSDGVLLGLNASGPIGPIMPGSAESYRNLHYDFKQNRMFDINDFKRSMGFKAMERQPVSGELRTPNSHWMGLALSRTSPAPLETVDDTIWQQRSGLAGPMCSPYGLGATTGLVDSTPTNRRLELSQYKDIHSLLTTLGLEHYIKTFVLNEIDLEMFTTLTEENLMELGITAFGARKKMILAINTLLANEAANLAMPSTSTGGTSSPRFSGSAAPGAERRPSNQW